MENTNASDPTIENGAAQANAPLTATCAVCGGQSSVDSRFCRHCGAALHANDAPSAGPVSPQIAATDAVAQPNLHAAGRGGNGQSLAAGQNAHAGEVPLEANGAASEIDERRARQLLDRAFMLAERGDMAAAILACRQSVALAPDSAPGFSMLGLLFERSGDLEKAAAAYEKVLSLAPDSRLEYESLQRLRATVTQQKDGAGFHFDDKELFDDGRSAMSNPPVVAVPPLGASTAGAIPGAPLRSVAGVANGAITGVVNASPSALNGFSPVDSPYAAATPSALTALDFGALPEATASPWQRLMNRPSFFFRGFPLVATTALGLMFMLWSRQAVVSQQIQTQDETGSRTVPSDFSAPTADNNPSNLTATQTNASVPATSSTEVSVPPNSAANSNGGAAFPVANRPPAALDNSSGSPAAGTPPLSTPDSNRNSARMRGDAYNSGTASRPAPRFPTASRIAPRRTETVNLPPAQLILPPPQVNQSSPARPLIRALPQESGDSGASSTGGSPLNPAGAAGRGYIRITPARPSTAVAPVRPANRALEAERAATTSSSAGRSERAIQNVTTAIEDGANTGKDTGWRYQQRALLFLEKGDNTRAANDFQLAISAYRDQIGRGERVSESRAGINACQSGLRLALSNLRR